MLLLYYITRTINHIYWSFKYTVTNTSGEIKFFNFHQGSRNKTLNILLVNPTEKLRAITTQNTYKIFIQITQIARFKLCAKYRQTVHANCAIQSMCKIHTKSSFEKDFTVNISNYYSFII